MQDGNWDPLHTGDVCMAWVCQTSGFVQLSGTVVCHNAAHVLGLGKSVCRASAWNTHDCQACGVRHESYVGPCVCVRELWVWGKKGVLHPWPESGQQGVGLAEQHARVLCVRSHPWMPKSMCKKKWATHRVWRNQCINQ